MARCSPGEDNHLTASRPAKVPNAGGTVRKPAPSSTALDRYSATRRRRLCPVAAAPAGYLDVDDGPPRSGPPNSAGTRCVRRLVERRRQLGLRRSLLDVLPRTRRGLDWGGTARPSPCGWRPHPPRYPASEAPPLSSLKRAWTAGASAGACIATLTLTLPSPERGSRPEGGRPGARAPNRVPNHVPNSAEVTPHNQPRHHPTPLYSAKPVAEGGTTEPKVRGSNPLGRAPDSPPTARSKVAGCRNPAPPRGPCRRSVARRCSPPDQEPGAPHAGCRVWPAVPMEEA